MKFLVGVYDLIYVKGEENDKNDEINRAIKGSLEICMLPEEERIWGVVHYHDLDGNSGSTFEQVFTKDFECKWSPCEGDGYNAEYVEERKEFIKNRINIEKSWLWNHMKLKLKEPQIARKIYEYKCYDVCSLQTTLQLKKDDKLLYFGEDRTTYPGTRSKWSATVRPDNQQGDPSEYMCPLPISEDLFKDENEPEDGDILYGYDY